MTDERVETDGYRQMLDAAPDAMVIVDASGSVRYVNRQTEALFGYAAGEVLGQKLETLVPQRFRAGHGGHVSRYFTSPAARPMGSGLELFGLRKDGTELQIEVSLSPVRTAKGMLVAAAIRDISDRKRIEAAAKLAADRLASAIESTEDALVLYDAGDRVVLCNSAYRRLVGDPTPGAVVGKTYAEILDGWLEALDLGGTDERARFRNERLGERSDPRGTFDVSTKDGRNLRVRNRRTIEGGIVQTIWDLTDDVRREQELQLARAAAEAGSAAKSEFLSSMSHELRTPLNAILGFAQLLQRDKREPLTQRHRERTDQIIKGGEHLLRLIDDILDLSRVEAGTVSISSESVHVLDVVEEVRATLAPWAARTQIALALALPGVDFPPVHADRTRLAQILMNFGSNAIKYNRPNGTVTIAPEMAASGAAVRVTVSDSGMGVPLDKQSKLFQPFQRAGQETGPIEGTGIGLVISKRLAELMGGCVGFESKPGEGSRFWVELPIHAEAAAPAPASPAAEPGRAALDHAPRRLVLYVEDNPANVAFMRDLLDSYDSIELVTAPTAEMGVELAQSRLPDVVIMDINLPGMSGLDALRVLVADSRTKDIPVIALTAAASERDKERGVQAGFYRYLTKPVRVDELIDALEPLLAAKS